MIRAIALGVFAAAVLAAPSVHARDFPSTELNPFCSPVPTVKAIFMRATTVKAARLYCMPGY